MRRKPIIPFLLSGQGEVMPEFEGIGMDRYEKMPEFAEAVKELRRQIAARKRAFERLVHGNRRRITKTKKRSSPRTTPRTAGDGYEAGEVGEATLHSPGSENLDR